MKNIYMVYKVTGNEGNSSIHLEIISDVVKKASLNSDIIFLLAEKLKDAW